MDRLPPSRTYSCEFCGFRVVLYAKRIAPGVIEWQEPVCEACLVHLQPEAQNGRPLADGHRPTAHGELV